MEVLGPSPALVSFIGLLPFPMALASAEGYLYRLPKRCEATTIELGLLERGVVVRSVVFSILSLLFVCNRLKGAPPSDSEGFVFLSPLSRLTSQPASGTPACVRQGFSMNSAALALDFAWQACLLLRKEQTQELPKGW